MYSVIFSKCLKCVCNFKRYKVLNSWIIVTTMLSHMRWSILFNFRLKIFNFYILLIFYISVRLRRYRKCVKSVFNRLSAELHGHRVLSGLFDRISDRICPVAFRHDLDVFLITEIYHNREPVNRARKKFQESTRSIIIVWCFPFVDFVVYYSDGFTVQFNNYLYEPVSNWIYYLSTNFFNKNWIFLIFYFENTKY